MDKLKTCAVAFTKLLNINYRFIIGRKGKTKEFTLGFDTYHFHHLAGLHKLSDIRELRTSRERIFKEILSDTITYETIKVSKDFSVIESRLNFLHNLEQFLDCNSIVFSYYKKNNKASNIEALYLLLHAIDESEIYLFIDKSSHGEILYGKSFFPKEQKDYTIGQTSYTLLYKEKLNIKTSDIIIQYDKLSKKEK